MLYFNDHIQQFTAEDVARAITMLPEWRREQALRFKFLAGQRECAFAYIELCRAMRLEHGIAEPPSFVYNEHGKPLLRDFPNVHFSLSHCKKVVGCLMSDRPCGLDIECIRPAKRQLVEYTMRADEVDRIFSSQCPDVAFTELWTKKEAAMKLLGTGITDSIRDVLEMPDVKAMRLRTIVNPFMGYVLTEAHAEQ